MSIALTDTEREDPRTFVGPHAIRLGGKSMRAARIRRNLRLLQDGEMVRPRLIVAVVHANQAGFSGVDRLGRHMAVQFRNRWGFGRGDTFPGANHGVEKIYYGAQLG